MMPDRNDDPFLDRIIDAILAQSVPDSPPDELRRQVLALEDNTSQPMGVSRSSIPPFLVDWVGMTAIAAALLVAFDLGWWAYVNAATPVAWFCDARTETWHTLYDTTRIKTGQPPTAIHDRM
jgi:hypothetical protein